MTAGPTLIQALADFLTVTVRCATPILFAAIGLVLMARGGIVNIGAEGMMLAGSLAAVAGSYYLGSAWAGVLVAAVISGLLGVLFAYFTVTLRANQMVTGTAINILGLGLTSTLDRAIFGINTTPPKIAAFKTYAIPVLSRIPVLGPAVFAQTPPVYLALLLVPMAHFILFRTTAGLAIRSVGEHPRAAETMGINVFKTRYATIVAGSMLAGIGGAYLSLGLLSFYAENMVAGRGFIALAAVIFGKYTPLGTLGATLLFGAGNALQFRLQATGSSIPQEFFLMVPYVLTLAALTGFVGKAIPPAELGRPYAKE